MNNHQYLESLDFWIKMESKRAYMTMKMVNQLGWLQRRVYDTLKNSQRHYKGITDQEIKKLLHDVDPNKVRPRRNELVKLGLVMCVGKRKCSVTQRESMIWAIV